MNFFSGIRVRTVVILYGLFFLFPVGFSFLYNLSDCVFGSDVCNFRHSRIAFENSLSMYFALKVAFMTLVLVLAIALAKYWGKSRKYDR